MVVFELSSIRLLALVVVLGLLPLDDTGSLSLRVLNGRVFAHGPPCANILFQPFELKRAAPAWPFIAAALQRVLPVTLSLQSATDQTPIVEII